MLRMGYRSTDHVRIEYFCICGIELPPSHKHKDLKLIVNDRNHRLFCVQIILIPRKFLHALPFSGIELNLS